MLIIFVMTIYVPAGIILLIADLLLIPGLWPVSYTHLDVYKRQVYASRYSAWLIRRCWMYSVIVQS